MKPEDILRIAKLLGLKELPADDPEFATGPQIHFLSDQSRDAGQIVKQPTDQGDATAQLNLGVMYRDGQGVVQDYAKAARFFSLAAAQGDAEAQHNLGFMYENGEGVVQDYAEAVKLYRLAAAQGRADAQYNLGCSYYNGQGVLQDYTEAVKWYKLAAGQGRGDAMHNLCVMYRDGQGVAQDYAEAEAWRKLAAALGYAGAGQGEVLEDDEDDENVRGREDCPVCDQSNKPLEGETCCHFVGKVFDDNDIEPPVSNIISAWHSLAEKKVHEAPRVVLLALASRIGVSDETIDALLESGWYFEDDHSQREFLDEICHALDLEQGELFFQTQGMLSGSYFSLYSKDPALLEKLAAESKLLDDAIT